MAEFVECPNCGYGLEAEWAVCPKCGQRLEGQGRPSQEMMTQILTKVIIGLVEAGLAQMEAEARKRGNDVQARQISMLARNLARELGPVAAEMAVTQGYKWAAGQRARHETRVRERVRSGRGPGLLGGGVGSGRGISRGEFGTRRYGRGGGRRGRMELEEEEGEEE